MVVFCFGSAVKFQKFERILSATISDMQMTETINLLGLVMYVNLSTQTVSRYLILGSRQILFVV